MTFIRPHGNHLTLEELPEGEGFKYYVANQKEKSQRGKVLAIGNGLQYEPPKDGNNGGRGDFDVQIGDIVHFKHYQADEIRTSDKNGMPKKYLILNQQGVLGKETPEIEDLESQNN